MTIHGSANPARRALRKAHQSGCPIEWEGERVRVVREFPHRTPDREWRYVFELEVVGEHGGPDTGAALARLLAEAKEAHAAYEASDRGAADPHDWAIWYAEHLLRNGLPELLAEADALDPIRLGAALRRLDDAYRSERPAVPWPVFYAERLLWALG